MNDTEFHQLADGLMRGIEDALDAWRGDSDIDYETDGGVMKLTFENGSSMVINRQEPLHQIWLATKTGGYHFDYRDNDWRCDRSGETFAALFSRSCSAQAGESFILKDAAR
ncbi:iron donor protein CyaY [Martelella alba]|uniref:Iron-sulfur cluster assembly protein CyaY n=1 Tax=Martelella alba TaxID=2590451 RepID=A0ABY2SHM3_9HYPH|nr:iron donor protein CyaY [Martelella alba]TKI04174.1 iron donor protein CyaY [Martelella alba]